jgi:hypothetical protein
MGPGRSSSVSSGNSCGASVHVSVSAGVDSADRMNITKTLMGLSASGRPMTDQEMLKWANTTVQKAKPGARTIRSFKDPSLTTSIFILDLLVPEDIVDLRPRLVCFASWLTFAFANADSSGIDLDVYRKFVGHCELVCDASKI